MIYLFWIIYRRLFKLFLFICVFLVYGIQAIFFCITYKMMVLKSRQFLFGLMFIVFMAFLCYLFLKWDIGINYQITNSINTLLKNQDGSFSTCERICSIKNDTRCQINPILIMLLVRLEHLIHLLEFHVVRFNTIAKKMLFWDHNSSNSSDKSHNII